MRIITDKVKELKKNGAITYSLLVEFKDQPADRFYNLVLYKKKNKHRIFTFEYITSVANGHIEDIKIHYGIVPPVTKRTTSVPPPYDGWDEDGDGTSGGDYTEECYDVTTWYEYSCTGAGHWVGEACYCVLPDYSCTPAYITSQTERVCGTVYVGDNNDGGSGSGSGGGDSTGDGDPVEVSTNIPQKKCPEGMIKDTNDICVEDDRIINELTGKAKCVFDKLKGIDLMNKTIERFNGESFVDLIIRYETPSIKAASAETVYGRPIIINIRKEHIDSRPSLFAALVMLHEGIHAEIYRKVLATGGLIYTPPNTYELNGARADFPTLFDYYNNYPDNPHHNYMADYYRNAIEQGLKDYANVNGLTFSSQLYKDLAWVGLQGTNAWNNMYADSIFTNNEHKRIIDSVNNFIISGTNECQ